MRGWYRRWNGRRIPRVCRAEAGGWSPSDEGAALFLEAVRSKELGLPGYGRPGMFPAEIIVETLSDVEVKENPQSP